MVRFDNGIVSIWVSSIASYFYQNLQMPQVDGEDEQDKARPTPKFSTVFAENSMKLHLLPRCPAVASIHSGAPLNYSQHRRTSNLTQCDGSFMSQLLDRRWTLMNPDSKINQISFIKSGEQHGGPSVGLSFSNNVQPFLGFDMLENRRQDPSFYIVRDDLLHPLVNGNKARKLDAVLPLVEDHAVTDVVTCGGCQSAHATAVAVSCAEKGLRSHLLLRGEQPDILTGYNLISTMFGNTIYIPRSLYAQREEMLSRHANLVAGSTGCVIQLTDILGTSFPGHKSEEVLAMDARRNANTLTHDEKHQKKVVIVNEGAGDCAALLGVIRLVRYLSQNHLFGKENSVKVVVDSGTGTTAIGLGIGAVCLGLPWEITAVMLADTIEGYRQQEKRLITDFKRLSGLQSNEHGISGLDGGIVNWVERLNPRKFGNVLKGEVESCQEIAQKTGILLDPIYTLAAWEHAVHFCQEEAYGDTKVVMLHTGGTLGMFGLAQRYKSFFHTSKGAVSGKM